MVVVVVVTTTGAAPEAPKNTDPKPETILGFLPRTGPHPQRTRTEARGFPITGGLFRGVATVRVIVHPGLDCALSLKRLT